MVLKKSKEDNATLFIDATNECEKVTNNNKLRERHIESILKMFTDRVDIDYKAKLVANSDIAENDYNLSVSTYIEKAEKKEKIDIIALNREIEEIVQRENILRAEIKKIIMEIGE